MDRIKTAKRILAVTAAVSMAAGLMTDMPRRTAAVQEMSTEGKAAERAGQLQVRNVNLNINGAIAGIHNPRQPMMVNAPWAAGKGSYVYFGNYWQSDTNKDGKADTSDTKEQVKWKVLSAENDSRGGSNPDSLFLMSDRVLDCVRYNDRIYNNNATTPGIGDELYSDAACSVYYSNYQGSNLRKWLLSEEFEDWVCGNGSTGNTSSIVTKNNYTQGGFLQNAFSEQEIDCVKPTTKRESADDRQDLDSGFTGENSPLAGDKVFLLSAKEACALEYGFYQSNSTYYAGPSAAISTEISEYAKGHANKIDDFYDSNYMDGVEIVPCEIVGMLLRSAVNGNSGGVVYVKFPYLAFERCSTFSSDMEVGRSMVYDWYGSRYIGQMDTNNLGVAPALNLDLSSILFATEHGFQSNRVFGETAANTTDEWDLTLKGGSGFQASVSPDNVKAGETVRVTVTDIGTAKTGITYNQISAMLVDESGTVAAYGRIANRAEPCTVSVALPNELEAGTYTMRVFAEQVNADGVNFASNLESDEIQVERSVINISSVAVTDIATPEAAMALDQSAVCETPGVYNTEPDVHWSVAGVPFTGEKADFHTAYTASVTLTPETGYVFNDYLQPSSVTVNGAPASSVTKHEDGTLTVTYTFPETAKAKLLRIITPDAVVGIANGTALADIPLPPAVRIETEDVKITAADVVWDRTSDVYDPSVQTKQSFTLNGVVSLPPDIDQNNVPLTVQIEVTVSEAGRVGAPWADVPSGIYGEDLSIGLRVSTEGAEIYYTIDGNVPDRENGILYTGELPVRGVTGQSVAVTLQAVAVKEGMSDSNITEYTYVVHIECQHENGTNVRNEKAATCTEDGYTGDTYCDTCMVLVEKGTVIPRKGHQFGETYTYDEKEHWKVCQNGCGTVDGKASHTMVNEITSMPTQEKGGVRTNRCTTCDYSFTETLEKLPVQAETEKPVKSAPPSEKPVESAPPTEKPVESAAPSEKPVESITAAETVRTVVQEEPAQTVSVRVQQLKTGDFSERDRYFFVACMSMACLILLELYRKLRDVSSNGE